MVLTHWKTPSEAPTAQPSNTVLFETSFNDGAKFDLFSDNASRKMVEVDTYGYWLRTAEAEYDTSFYYVSSRNGSIDVMAAVNGCGVIACFVIG